jgi:hypothetical protein
MLALVTGVERYVARHDIKFTTAHAAAWRRSGEVVDKAARCGIVVVGDSLVKHGVVAPVVAGSAGRSAYNLAVPKGMFPAHDVLLRRLLRAGARPEALVVDGEMLGEDPFANPRIWPELLTLPECADLALAGRDPHFLAQMVLAAALPSFKARAEVRLSIRSALAGTVAEEPQGLPVLWRNWKRNAGSEVLADRHDPPGHDPRLAELDAADYRPAYWACHPVSAAYVDLFLGRAAARGIPVFWMLPPYHPEVEARRERYGQYGQYVAYLRLLVDRYPNLTVVDGRGSGYPPEVLFDMTHLSRTGAIAYSDALGRLLRDRLAGPSPSGPRWVKLPRFDPAAAAALAAASDVEDVPRSGLELARIMEGERRKRAERQVARDAGPAEERRRR